MRAWLLIPTGLLTALSCSYDFKRFARESTEAGTGGSAVSPAQAGGRGGAPAVTSSHAGGSGFSPLGSQSGGAGNAGDGGTESGGGAPDRGGAGGEAGDATGPNSAGATSHPGTAGSEGGGEAGSSSGGSGNPTGTTRDKRCPGAEFEQTCWYLGAPNASCNQVCETRGGVAANSASLIGIAAQGGSPAECRKLLTLLGVTAGLSQGTRSDGLGLGCHVFIDDPDRSTNWWLASPAFNADSRHRSARLVCGCRE